MTPRPPRQSDSAYLENLTRKVFISGFAWEPVRNKWPRFREAFYQFDPGMVADMPEPLIEHLCQDAGLIRNRVKIRATVKNGHAFLKIAEEFGSFWDYLRSLDDLAYEDRARAIAKRFAATGPNTVYYFLMDCGEPVPDEKPDGVK
ncbi:MAG: DNA-3-methyladenine glycosylase I [Dehalococcoidia bacterium]